MKNESKSGIIVDLVESANLLLSDEGKKKLVELLEEENIEVRICTHCHSIMTEGYCIESGEAYYCSSECLESEMSREDYEQLYNDGDGDSYWTQWN